MRRAVWILVLITGIILMLSSGAILYKNIKQKMKTPEELALDKRINDELKPIIEELRQNVKNSIDKIDKLRIESERLEKELKK